MYSYISLVYLCFQDTLLIFWWISESLSLYVFSLYGRSREYLFLILQIFARDYCSCQIGVVRYYLRGVSWIYTQEWKNEKYENYEWKNELSIDLVQIKFSKTWIHAWIHLFRSENRMCLASAQKWFPFTLFVFLL